MKKKIGIIALIALSMSQIISGQQKWEEVPVYFSGVDTLREQYGVCAHITRKGSVNDWPSMDGQLSIAKGLGISYIRADFDWRNIQNKEKGKFDMSVLDDVVNSAEKYGVKLMPILGYTNTFCAKPSEQLSLWDEYVKTVVSRYSSKISSWEIWNEENLSGFWKPKPNAAEYGRLLNNTDRLLKAMQPESDIILGGLAEMEDTEYLELLLANIDMSKLDILGLHYYPWIRTPENIIKYMSNIQKVLDVYKKGLPVWLTETGFSSLTNRVFSDDEQARRLSRLFICSFAVGIDRVFWYKLRSCEVEANNTEHHFGIIHEDLTPKPSYYAFKTLIEMLPDGSMRPKLKHRGNLYVAEWSVNGEKIYAIWCAQNSERVRIQSSGSFVAYDFMGNVKRVRSRQKISDEVLYIKGASNLEIL